MQEFSQNKRNLFFYTSQKAPDDFFNDEIFLNFIKLHAVNIN